MYKEMENNKRKIMYSSVIDASTTCCARRAAAHAAEGLRHRTPRSVCQSTHTHTHKSS